jgi:hypothetical protein
VQKNTSRRSQYTLAQQFRWFKLYRRTHKFLREKNTGVCNKTGKSFGEVSEYFILSGNETCLIADADGDLRIVGERGRKKQEEKVSNFWGLVTMYCTGTAVGNNGPTAFLMKGQKGRVGYTSKFLRMKDVP